MVSEGSLGVARQLVAVDIADARQNFPDSQPLASALRIQAALENALGNYTTADALIADAGPAFNGKGRQEVFVVDDGNRARRIPIEIGLTDGHGVQVEILVLRPLPDRPRLDDLGDGKIGQEG